jgi:hypothetical protein
MPEFEPIKDGQNGPIEVWLTKANIEVICRVIFEDETDYTLPVDSLSMRGAQREMTAWLIGRGYEPAGRWLYETEEGYDEGEEAFRKFRPRKNTSKNDK